MKSKIIIVKPVAGKRVLDPAANPPKPLPEKGKRVVQDSYWLRRKEAGEVTFTETITEIITETTGKEAPKKTDKNKAKE